MAFQDYGIFALVAGLTGVGTGIATWFRGKEALRKEFAAELKELSEKIDREISEQDAKTQQQFKEIWDKVVENHEKHVIMSTRFDVFWTVMEKEGAKLLIRYSTPELDALVAKMENGTITEEERNELADLMLEEARKYKEPPKGEDENSPDYFIKQAKGFYFTFYAAGIKAELAGKEKEKEIKDSKKR